jgi:hypothetical protein
MIEQHTHQPGIPKEEILKNIIGYSTLVKKKTKQNKTKQKNKKLTTKKIKQKKITTPFGQKCALYADHTATGRPY